MKTSAAKKVKVSVTISPRVLAAVDRYVKHHKTKTRSGVIELWLEQAATRDAALRLERETIEYYASIDNSGRGEDETWARYGSQNLASPDND